MGRPIRLRWVVWGATIAAVFVLGVNYLYFRADAGQTAETMSGLREVGRWLMAPFRNLMPNQTFAQTTLMAVGTYLVGGLLLGGLPSWIGRVGGARRRHA